MQNCKIFMCKPICRRLNFKYYFRSLSNNFVLYASSLNTSEIDIPYSEQENDIKPDILEASLLYVGQFGWSRYAIIKGALSLGLPGVIQGVFVRGGYDLVHHFNAKCNEEFEEKLKLISDGQSNLGYKDVSTEFLIKAIQLRLSLIKSYLKRWPQLAVQSSYPNHTVDSLASLLKTADHICYYGGCRDSTGAEWYAQRLKVAAIYRMAEVNFVARALAKGTNFEIPVQRVESDGRVLPKMDGCITEEECGAVTRLVESVRGVGEVLRPLASVATIMGKAFRPKAPPPFDVRPILENVYPAINLFKNLLGISRP